MTKKFIEYSFPGIMFNETTEEEIKSRKEPVNAPMSCQGYRFFDRLYYDIPGEKGKKGKLDKNYSGMLYFGTEYSIEEIKEKFPNEKILLRNLKQAAFKRVVQTITGNWQGLRARDKVISKP